MYVILIYPMLDRNCFTDQHFFYCIVCTILITPFFQYKLQDLNKGMVNE